MREGSKAQGVAACLHRALPGVFCFHAREGNFDKAV